MFGCFQIVLPVSHSKQVRGGVFCSSTERKIRKDMLLREITALSLIVGADVALP